MVARPYGTLSIPMVHRVILPRNYWSTTEPAAIAYSAVQPSGRKLSGRDQVIIAQLVNASPNFTILGADNVRASQRLHQSSIR